MSYARTATFLSGVIALLLGGGFLTQELVGLALGLAAAGAGATAAYRLSGRFPGGRLARFRLTRWPGLPLQEILRDLSMRAGIAPPHLFLIHDDNPNAFASGRTKPIAAVGVTDSLLSRLSEREIRGVLAHEIAHIVRRDARRMTLSATFWGVAAGIAGAATIASLEVLSPSMPWPSPAIVAAGAVVAVLGQMWSSRRCEFDADRRGAEICGAPLWIAAALERIETLGEQSLGLAQPSWAIETFRFGARREKMFALISTHPTTSERIRRLRQQAGLADPWV